MSNQLRDVLQKQQEQKKPNTETENIIQLVAFVVGSEEFAVPILSIQEIIKVPTFKFGQHLVVFFVIIAHGIHYFTRNS